MIDWRVLAVTVPALFVMYQTLAKALPKGASIFLVNAYIAAVGLVIMLVLHLFTQSDKSLQLSAKGLWLALAMGALIAFGNFGIIKAYSYGAPQSIFTPLFYISLIVYGILFGLVIWHEKLQLIQVAGILLATLGIFLAVYPKIQNT